MDSILLWQLEGITSLCYLLSTSRDLLPSSFYGERWYGISLYMWQKGIFASSFSYSSPLGEHESLVKSISTGSHITQDWGPVQGLCVSLVYSHLSNTQLLFLTSVIHRETHTECINGFLFRKVSQSEIYVLEVLLETVLLILLAYVYGNQWIKEVLLP